MCHFTDNIDAMKRKCGVGLHCKVCELVHYLWACHFAAPKEVVLFSRQPTLKPGWLVLLLAAAPGGENTFAKRWSVTVNKLWLVEKSKKSPIPKTKESPGKRRKWVKVYWNEAGFNMKRCLPTDTLCYVPSEVIQSANFLRYHWECYAATDRSMHLYVKTQIYLHCHRQRRAQSDNRHQGPTVRPHPPKKNKQPPIHEKVHNKPRQMRKEGRKEGKAIKESQK